MRWKRESEDVAKKREKEGEKSRQKSSGANHGTQAAVCRHSDLEIFFSPLESRGPWFSLNHRRGHASLALGTLIHLLLCTEVSILLECSGDDVMG